MIVDIASMDELGTCHSRVSKDLDDMTAEQYHQHIMQLPIETCRKFRYYGEAKNADEAWLIILPYLEKSGLLQYVDIVGRRETDNVVSRPGYIHAKLNCRYVSIHVRPMIDGDYGESSYIFTIPIVRDLPVLAPCKCARHRALDAPEPSIELQFRNRAIEAGIDPDIFIQHAQDACRYDNIVLSVSQTEMWIIRDYIAAMRCVMSH